MSRAQLRIGELAELLGVTPKTVRHYHKLGLLSEPPRSEGGYRLYTSTDLFQLRRIRRLQGLGLSLQEIRSILEAEHPDAMLRQALEKLQAELSQQQERLQARQQRIAQVLLEEASLAEVEQGDGVSAHYAQLRQTAGHLPTLPDALTNFDAQVFSQWEDFNLGEGYDAAMQLTMEQLAQHEHAAAFSQIVERMNRLATMPEDDPQIAHWVEETRQSGLIETLVKAAAELPQVSAPASGLMKQLALQSAEQHLSPAQRRFLELLMG